MELPALPKQRGTEEADFGLDFRKWIYDSLPPTAAFELKSTRGASSFPFRELKDIQAIKALRISTEGKGELIRVERGTIGAPDYIWLNGEPAYVVIEYPQGFVLIDIKTFLEEKNTSKTSSLSYFRAVEISLSSIENKRLKV